MPLPLITVQTFNQTTLQAAGAVFVQRVEALSVSRGLLAGITGAAAATGTSGRNELMEKKMNELTKSLLAELDTQAKKTYPNAIGLVNADIDFSTTGQDTSMMLIGQASATVLIKRNKPLSQTALSVPPASAPLGSAPLGSAPIGSAPLGFAPLASVPLGSAPMPLSRPEGLPVKGGSKQRTFLTKRLIKSSRKNRK